MFADGSLLGLVDDGQATANRLADISNTTELGGSAGAADLGDAQVIQLLLTKCLTTEAYTRKFTHRNLVFAEVRELLHFSVIESK